MQSNYHFFLFLFLVVNCTCFLSAQEDQITPLPIKAEKDTLKAPILDFNPLTNERTTDTIAVDSINAKQPLILDQIKYNAKDYVRLSKKEQKIYLYNEAELYYQDTELKAGIIVLDYVKNEVYAGRIRNPADSTFSQHPQFKQGNQEVIPDSIRFNFDTKKALIWNSRTEQQAQGGALGSDAMKVLAQITKKENDSVYFMKDAKITTSKDTIDPDYYIRVRKAKFVPGKKVIAGFSNMYLVDVPTPIALPFAYFPLSKGRTAGLIFPTFGNDPQRGYFIQNGGYYFPISDYVDFSILGDFYTNGSYGFRTQSIYTKRYRFNGSVDFNFQNLIQSQKGFDDFNRTTEYRLAIRHSQDPKASPNSRLSANVNLGSQQFFQNSLNQRDQSQRQTNTQNSSINYSKTFPAYPSVNLSVTVSQSQNSNTGAVNVILPTLQGSMERVFPFAKRDGIKKGFFKNINLQYNFNAQNNINTTQEDFLTSRMFDDARVGALHRIPITTNFKVAKYFSVSAGVNYEDRWTLETFRRGQDPDNPDATRAVVLDTISGFDRFGQYSLNASVGTTVYGTFNFGEGKKIQAIRHVMRPSIGWSYRPSFDQFYDSFVNDNGTEVFFSRFEGTLNGAPNRNRSNSLSFSLQNTLEAKVRDKDSTALEPKKVKILSNLNLSTNYNFEADSLKLGTVNLSGATEIISKVPINFRATLDPYAIDNNGRRINTFNIANGGGLMRLTSAQINTGFSLNSEMFKKGGEKSLDGDKDENKDFTTDPFENGLGDIDDFSQRQRFDNDESSEDTPITKYGTKLPWDARFTYVATYNNRNRNSEITNHSLMFSGNIKLSPKWEVGFNSGYDIKNSGFTDTRFAFSRDLGSFTLRFDWTPFGRFERWYFFIGIKSSLLKDLKWENRSQPFRR